MDWACAPRAPGCILRAFDGKKPVGDAMHSLSLKEIESEARRHLDPAVYDFIAGGADDEITLRANEAAFARIGLVPRVLRGAGAPELGVSLFGRRLATPILVA